MATSLPLPGTSLTVGTHTVGPVATGNVSSATLTFDRTAGMNTAPSSTTLALVVDISNDGGSTWRTVSSDQRLGGIILDDFGTQINTDSMIASWGAPVLATHTRVRLIVGGASIALGAASLVIG